MDKSRRIGLVTALSLLAVSVAMVTAALVWPASPAEARRNPQAEAAIRRARAERTPTPQPTIVVENPTAAATPVTEVTTAPTTPEATAPATSATADSTTPAPAPTLAPAPAPTIALAPYVGFSDDFEAMPEGVAWGDGSTNGAWYSRYNGYGTVAIETDGDKVLSLSPKAATATSTTHAALVLSTMRFNDVDFTVQVKTATQLRTPVPNAWESGWALWHFTDDTHFYYVALKPNGIEVGKEDPAYPGAQRFLVTLSNPSFAVGRWYTVRVKHVGTTFSIWIDGTLVTTFTDTERPYTGGTVGLYTEDADVHFNNFSARQP